jgi:hypothetical protein
MNDPDGMVQTIREQEKHIADLELRLKIRDKRIRFWESMSMDLYDHLIDFYAPSTDPDHGPNTSLTAVIEKYEEAQRYGSQ